MGRNEGVESLSGFLNFLAIVTNKFKGRGGNKPQRPVPVDRDVFHCVIKKPQFFFGWPLTEGGLELSPRKIL